MSEKLELAKIRLDGGTQPRAELDQVTIDDYAEDMANGDTFPPVTVFFDGTDYWLADGYHRLKAHAQLGLAHIDADVRQGDKRAAVLFSVSANAQHGKRRTNADKRRAVLTLLGDEEWRKWSNVQIATHCKVSEFHVRSLRENRSEGTQRTYITKHGTVATMNTGNIGKSALGTDETAPIEETPSPIQIAQDGITLAPAPIDHGGTVIPEDSASLSAHYELFGAPANTEDEGSPLKSGRQKPKINRTGDLYVPQGHDLCQTPPEAIDPLLPYLPSSWTIWEPARGEGLLVEALYDSGFEHVVTGDIQTGQNFFDYQPESWDCLVTNPPYSIKFKWIERCYELGKPFALLLPVETLGAKTAQQFFREHGVEVIFLDRRINFKMPNLGWEGSGAQFPVAWFTFGLDLGQQMVFARLTDDVYGQKSIQTGDGRRVAA